MRKVFRRHGDHAYAFPFEMLGVGLNTSREFLGHKSLSMTIRYSHLSATHRMEAVQRLNEKIVTKMSPQDFEKPHTQNRFTVTASN